ncbi:MAG: hypothetical protein JST01_22020 [Cyanobacteria bacterium SZAS TMP-1]|nr:hypothetical protein [Cyanobacteria bacterium SZAS TMP-1]
MRTDQYYGLNSWARNLVLATQKVEEIGVRRFPDDTIEPFIRSVDVPVAKITKIGEIDSAFMPGMKVADLNRYELPTGEVYEEYIQAQPWNSGPCSYIALKDGAGEPVRESLWMRKPMA